MQDFWKISQQTFWQVIGKGISSISTFIILGIIARNYHEQGIGIFTLALTYLTMFNLLADFGFNAHVLRKVGLKASGEWNKLLGTRIIWSVVLVAIAITLLPFLPITTPEFSKAVIFGSLAIIGYSIFITSNLIFQSRLRYDLSVLSSSLGILISLGLFVFLGLQKYPVFFLFLAHLTGWIIIAVSALLLVKNFLPKIAPVFDYRYIKDLFKNSWPIAATLALNVIYFRVDSFLIAYFKGLSNVGIYNVAYSIFQSVLVLPTFIMNAYYPLMLKSQKGIKFVGLGLLGLGFLSTLLILILAPEIVKILTGGGFAGSISSLQILSLGFPAFFLSSLFMWLMLAKGHYKKMLVIYILGLIINLSLNLILIPQYSFYGASWITVISEYCILLMQILALRGIIFA